MKTFKAKKIHDFKSFTLGVITILLSYFPFAYLNHADKFELKNLYKINGKVLSIKENFTNSARDGWTIKLENINYKIRIIGDYYNIINQEKFERLVKPTANIEVYFLKTDFNGILEIRNNQNKIKDAVIISSSNTEILKLKDVKNIMSNLFIRNLVLGSIFLGLGVPLILLSFKPSNQKPS